MTGRLAIAIATLAAVLASAGCVSISPNGVESTESPAPAVVVPPPAGHSAATSSAPSPPKPSLARLTNRQRPHLDFAGATIYADFISESGASGNVFLDGRDLHQVNRSFPIAVYASHADVDLKKEKVTLSGWPLVQTDSAFVQAQAADTAVVLSRDRMTKIRGPARYVIGTRESDLFTP
jgi:hypothetical protein